MKKKKSRKEGEKWRSEKSVDRETVSLLYMFCSAKPWTGRSKAKRRISVVVLCSNQICVESEGPSHLARGGRLAQTPALWSLSSRASRPRNPMKNRHNDMLDPIRAIPFVFSTNSFLASGFSTLRCPVGTGSSQAQPSRSMRRTDPTCGPRYR